jgi:hypothetical protein
LHQLGIRSHPTRSVAEDHACSHYRKLVEPFSKGDLHCLAIPLVTRRLADVGRRQGGEEDTSLHLRLVCRACEISRGYQVEIILGPRVERVDEVVGDIDTRNSLRKSRTRDHIADMDRVKAVWRSCLVPYESADVMTLSA